MPRYRTKIPRKTNVATASKQAKHLLPQHRLASLLAQRTIHRPATTLILQRFFFLSFFIDREQIPAWSPPHVQLSGQGPASSAQTWPHRRGLWLCWLASLVGTLAVAVEQESGRGRILEVIVLDGGF
jgi:hypothetical protein